MCDQKINKTLPPLAWITGASSGIGMVLARQLAQKGYATCLIARRGERLEKLASELSCDAPSYFEVIDLAKVDQLKGQFTRLLEQYGCPDVLINNAGFGHYQLFEKTSSAMRDQLLDVNYRAAAESIAVVLPLMIKRQRGHVINIASIAAGFGPWGHGPYAAAKAALVALTESLAVEHAQTPIHFSYVKPGVIRTEFFDDPTYQTMQKQVARHGVGADDLAKLIVKLIDKPKLALFYPRHYRFLELIKAISPSFASWMVRKNSQPPA